MSTETVVTGTHQPAYVITHESGAAQVSALVQDAGVDVQQMVTSPPPESWLSRFAKTPHGEGLAIWGRGVGVLSAYVVPVVVLVGAGSLIGGIDPWGASPAVGGALGAVAGILGGLYQGGLDAIDVYRQEGHPRPRLAAFRDVMAYMAAPAIVGGTAVAELANGGWGVGAAVAAGVIGASIGLTTFEVRCKRVDAAEQERKALQQ